MIDISASPLILCIDVFVLCCSKRYKESIPHFEDSLNINSLQSDLWFRLGFAALHEEQWELGAKAYRRYCALEPEVFF